MRTLACTALLLATFFLGVSCDRSSAAGPDTLEPPEQPTVPGPDTLSVLSQIPGSEKVLLGKIVTSVRNEKGGSEIAVIDTSGSVRFLTRDSIPDECPMISPDGKKIAFKRAGKLVAMNVDRSDFREIAAFIGERSVSCAIWAADSRRIAYSMGEHRTKSFSTGWLFYAPADSGTSTEVMTGDAIVANAWSPDGATIIFTSFKTTDGGPYDYAINAVTTTGTRLSRSTLDSFYTYVSPDGKRVAYICHPAPDSTPQLCVSDLSGLNRVQLTTDGGATATWSSDAKQIAYGYSTRLAVMNADGSGKVTLASDLLAAKSWLRDGNRIAYACGTFSGSQVQSMLCIMRSDRPELIRTIPVYTLSDLSISP